MSRAKRLKGGWMDLLWLIGAVYLGYWLFRYGKRIGSVKGFSVGRSRATRFKAPKRCNDAAQGTK